MKTASDLRYMEKRLVEHKFLSTFERQSIRFGELLLCETSKLWSKNWRKSYSKIVKKEMFGAVNWTNVVCSFVPFG